MEGALEQNGLVRLTLTGEELALLNNALNEVCHGFEVANFEAAIGISKESALHLLRGIHDRQPSAGLELKVPELLALRNVLTAVLAELDSWEYPLRMGSAVLAGERMRDGLDTLAGQARFAQLHKTA